MDDILDQNGNFITAQAGHRIRRAQRCAQASAHLSGRRGPQIRLRAPQPISRGQPPKDVPIMTLLFDRAAAAAAVALAAVREAIQGKRA